MMPHLTHYFSDLIQACRHVVCFETSSVLVVSTCATCTVWVELTARISEKSFDTTPIRGKSQLPFLIPTMCHPNVSSQCVMPVHLKHCCLPREDISLQIPSQCECLDTCPLPRATARTNTNQQIGAPCSHTLLVGDLRLMRRSK